MGRKRELGNNENKTKIKKLDTRDTYKSNKRKCNSRQKRRRCHSSIHYVVSYR
jgi:hypothetical protein